MEAKEIMAGSYFDKCLTDSIETYTKRKPAESGRRYIRTPWDSLFEKGVLTVEGLRREFNEIIEKKSKLSAGERQVVSNIVMAALRRASVRMQMEEQKKKSAQPAKKPQETKIGDARTDVPDGDRKGRREKISKK